MIDSAPEVLDASALLAYLRNEPGTGRVESSIRNHALVSSVNYAEVLTRLQELGLSPAEEYRSHRDRGLIDGLVAVAPFETEDAIRAAELRTITRHLGLSLGDRACLALGLRMGRPVLTADRAWVTLAVGIEVRLIRP